MNVKVNEKWKAKFGKRKQLCGLGVSAVKQPRIIDLLFFRRACFAEAMQAEGAEGAEVFLESLGLLS